MPTYVYKGCYYHSDDGGTEERNVPIAERDEQRCTLCNRPLERAIAFTGLTWAPTAGGYR